MFATVKEENTWILVILPEEGEELNIKWKKEEKNARQTKLGGINIIPASYLQLLLP